MSGRLSAARAADVAARLRRGGRRRLQVLLTDVLAVPRRAPRSDGAVPVGPSGLSVAAVVEAYERATGPGSPWSAPAQWALASRPPSTDLDLRTALRVHRRGGADARGAARARRKEALADDRIRVGEVAAAIEAEAAACVVGGLRSGAPTRPPARRDRPCVVADVRCLQAGEHDTRGVGKHALSLLRVLVRVAAADPRDPQVVGLVDAAAGALSPAAAALLDLTVAHAGDLGVGDVLMFLQLSPMTEDSTVAAPFLAAPWVRRAAAAYDLIPYRAPWRYLPDETSRTAYEARLLAMHAYDIVLPISRATAADLVALAGLLPSRLQVTGVADPLGEPGGSLSTGADRRPAGERARGGGFALAPTGADGRKDLPCAVAAYALARSRGVDLGHLVVVGRLSQVQRESVLELGLALGLDRDELVFRSDVADAELVELYSGASVAVVTSIAEGFSLPLAEAVRRGTPVVASDIPPHRELLGEGAWLGRPRDPVSVGGALVAVLSDADAAAAQQKRSLGDLASPGAVEQRATEALQSLLASAPDRAEPGPSSPSPLSSRRRPRLAVVTPWRPQFSGISDFSAATVAALAETVDVEVHTEADRPEPGPVPVHDLTVEPYLDPGVDAVLSVLGNSLLHVSILELVRRFGGAVLAHDSRMFEVYLASRGWEQAAALVGDPAQPMGPEQFHRTLMEPDLLPRLGFGEIGPHARPLLVHSEALADRLVHEGVARPVPLPFVPYLVPSGAVDRARVTAARDRLGLGEDLVVASFGMVDVRTKGADHLVAAVRWCEVWGARPVLHLVGPVADPERRDLLLMARRLGMVHEPRFHGHVSRDELEDWLLAADVGIQLRRLRLGVSGALADCIAHGLPTVATAGIAEELDAPGYVARVEREVTPMLLGEQLLPMLVPRLDRVEEVELEREAYLGRRNMGVYARRLMEAIDEGWLPA